jgi:magnesium transporter
MGGIAGTQAVTLVVRGLALDQVQSANARWLLRKELGVAVLTGLALAIVLVCVVTWWLGSWRFAGVAAVAMFVNILASAFLGVLLPLALHRLRVDPALSAGMVLTTLTDAVGFTTLLALATIA